MRRSAVLLAAVAIVAGCGGAERAPHFEAAKGWNVLVEPGQTAAAANVRFAPGDRTQSLPSRTIASLPPRGVLIWVEWVRPRKSSAEARLYPRRTLPLRIEAAAGTGGPEGASCPPAAPDCFIRHLTARESDWDSDVWIFFGRDDPLPEDVAAADAELARLQVQSSGTPSATAKPLDCPRPAGTGYYATTTAPSSGPPGSTVTLTGRLPVLSESGGSIGQSATEVIAYWNLALGRWTSLASTTPRAATARSPVKFLGLRNVAGRCAYHLRVTIPSVPPGTYPIEVLYGDVHGRASFAPTRFRVTNG